MTPDDVKAGQLVAVVKHLCGRVDCEVEFTGAPFKVVCVSLPFAVLECMMNGTNSPIDLREWQLGKVSAAYVRACQRNCRAQDDKPEPTSKVNNDDGHKRCVCCGERLVQRNTTKIGWCWWCQRCEKI